ncbi:hypothetical protein KAFR_0B06580 [Kazachstania africana CBS 2517]|uniref:Tafazzin family protein n=1 Tax=Kazachstania africana (strain ATCC 22294 / BCRC 22015 / CBS 2517 / CECT 1963 / NBRC 1671 / NRRL Y-8276) TaxID=1071382 RepID=H2ARF4_KAZAF|nr:hypothetical protein KAFR_0B06580 [Kazachstania africana CBS 2517]CCF56954.1 hypothetical protein KAFR_0B06580 [Kazachstania africana CBS 2517]
MVFTDVYKRGDDFLAEYPRRSPFWRFLSFSTNILVLCVSKMILKTFYNVKLNDFDHLENAMKRAKDENRGIITIMNHMSTLDDPLLWACFPMKTYSNLSNMRWCLGANNICFANKALSTFFSLGQVLSTERFGVGPFQGSIDAAIRLLSPDDTISKLFQDENYNPPIIRNKPSWVHIYPEGFVLQLHPPYANSMRYFKWGMTRMILEPTKPPIVVPIFTTGFEKLAPEDKEDQSLLKNLYNAIGTEINITVGKPIDDEVIDSYRSKWMDLIIATHAEQETDLTDELKNGTEAKLLRSRLASELRLHVANIRHHKRFLPMEDLRFGRPEWWKIFTKTEGSSDPDVEFIGENWAIRRLQKFLNENQLKINNSDDDDIVNSDGTTESDGSTYVTDSDDKKNN